MIDNVKEGFLYRIKSRLQHLKEKSDNKLNFTCPFCFEGKSFGKKQRAFILKDKNYNFYCHNCGVSTTFSNFLKFFDYNIYQDYVSSLKQKNIEEFCTKTGEDILQVAIIKDDEVILKDLDSRFKKAENVIEAYEYMQKRKIPFKFWDDIWFSDYDKKMLWHNSIIFPMRKNGKIYGFISRNIYTKFFHIELVDESNPKIWNLFSFDKSMPVYICESIMDAMLLPNAIAMNGADIGEQYLKQIQKPVFVFDNDETGLKKAKKYAEQNYKVFVWPDIFKIGGAIKDLNDIAQKKIEYTKIKKMIDSNTCEGKEAIIKLKLKEI